MPFRDNCFDCGKLVTGFESVDPPNVEEDGPFTDAQIIDRPPGPQRNYRVECKSCGSHGPTAATPQLAVQHWNDQIGRRP